jgi:hypothetical protein
VFLPALSAFHHLPSDMMDHVRPRPGCDRLRFMASSVPGARRRPQPPSCRARRRRHRDTRNTATTRQRPPPSRDFGIETRRHGKILKQETSLWSTVWGSGIIEESTLRETLPHIVRDTLAMEVFCSLMQPRDPGTLRIVPDFTCCNAILDCFYSTYYSVACNASLLVFSASHLLIVFTWPRLPSVYSPIKQTESYTACFVSLAQRKFHRGEDIPRDSICGLPNKRISASDKIKGTLALACSVTAGSHQRIWFFSHDDQTQQIVWENSTPLTADHFVCRLRFVSCFSECCVWWLARFGNMYKFNGERGPVRVIVVGVSINWIYMFFSARIRCMPFSCMRSYHWIDFFFLGTTILIVV